MRKRVENGYLGCFSELTEGKRTGKNLLQMLIEEYFPFGGSDSKEFACNAAAPGSIPGLRRSPGEGMATHSTPVFLPGDLHGQRSLVDYSSWGRKRFGHDSATNTHTHIHMWDLVL